MKKISIIIPHYNSWDKLEILLNSIPELEWIEAIVIDDHSDNNQNNISNFQKKFPNIIFAENDQRKKGAGAARNRGLGIASGSWLLFADSDDVFIRGFEKVVKPYIELDYDIVYFTPTSFIDSTDKVSSRHKPYERYINNYLNNPNRYNDLKLRHYFVVPWSKLIRKDLVEKNNILFEEVMVSNDLLFSAKIGFYAEKIYASKEKIYAVRENEGSLTTDISEEKFNLRFDEWLKYVKFLQSNLHKEDLRLIRITAYPQISKVLQTKLGLKKLKEVIKESRENNIEVFDKRLLNPLFVIKKFRGL